MNSDRKKHWETVYETKNPQEVSWTQEIPQTSLDFINSFNLDKAAKIIDIGGGDSKLVDHLLDQGFENITVLDISEKALEKAKVRLVEKASKVTWIVSDILDFEPIETYDMWHDRAAYHFLTTEKDIEKYKSTVEKAGACFLIIGTFSENGPSKCSGLEITQYNEGKLKSIFNDTYDKIDNSLEDHQTPFGTTQNFLFCSFKRKLVYFLNINFNTINMFGLFSKKEKSLLVHDKIWLSDQAKFKACLILKQSNPTISFAAWFDETKNNLEQYFKENKIDEEVYLADRLTLMHQEKELVFVEHHPLRTEEQRIADQLSAKEMTIYSSISEPIFQLFGGAKIVELMKRMGMKEEEMIEHDMISKSILRAQEKIAEKTTQNISAKSQGEWLQNTGHKDQL